MESTAAIWEILVRNDREVVTGDELAALAKRLGRDPRHVARHLRRVGYLRPLFKGYYYVAKPEEVRLGDERLNPLETFALAASAKDIGTWYFGLETALRINGMTHEHRRDEAVICDRLYRIGGVSIGKRRFVIHKWSPRLVSFGLLDGGRYRYSDPEKTVLDLAYLDFCHEVKGRAPSGLWREHIEGLDARKARRYAPAYPEKVALAMEGAL